MASASQGVTVSSEPEVPNEPAETIIVDEAETIIGGTTQSTDPTRDDYVPDFEPLDANGVGTTRAFAWTWQGASISVPNGFLGHKITGSGLRITQERVNWGPALNVGQICNFRFTLQNRYGSTIYSTVRMPLHSGCKYFGTPNYY